MPSPIQVIAPVGVCSYKSGAYAFVRGSDQNIWVSWQVGSTDAKWLNLGGPVSEGIGALACGQFMFAFAKNQAGGLSCFWFTGTGWTSTDLGAPAAGVTIVSSAGVTGSGKFVFVFVRGSDGNLWTCWWDGAAWHWLSLDKPSPSVTASASVGIAVTPGGWNGNPVIYVFVQGSDNHLWTKWWNGFAWAWVDFGVGMAAPVGAVYNGTFIYVFVKGTNGNLCCHWLNGSNWIWADLGLPPGITLAEGLGASAYSGNPNAFFRGSDGNLWANAWGAGKWNWVNMGHPRQATVAGPVGVCACTAVSGAISDSDKAVAGLGVSLGSIQVVAGVLKAGQSGMAGEKGAAAGGLGGAAGGGKTIADNAIVLANAAGTTASYQFVFVRGTDGHLWQNFSTSTQMVWSDLGTVDWT